MRRMVCTGACSLYGAPKADNGARYDAGQKWCTTCYRFLDHGGYLCPCCGRRLRSRPKNSGARKAMRRRAPLDA